MSADVTFDRCNVCGFPAHPNGIDDEYMASRSRQAHEDHEARARFRRAVRELVASVKAYPYMWVWGDGHGGAVLVDIDEAFRAAGFESRETSQPRGKQKKQLPAKVRAQVMARDGLRCVQCGCDDIEELGVDHIIADANGGPGTLDNLQTLCRPCNSRKGTK